MRKLCHLSAFFIALAAAAAVAGPVATIELQGASGDAGRISAEILDFADGSFTVRRLDSGQTVQIAVETVRAIDFGPEPREAGAGALLDPDSVVRMATAREFAELRAAFAAAARSERREQVVQAEQRLAREMDQTDLASEKRKNFLIARVLAARTLGEEKAAQELLALLHKDFPGAEMPRLDRRETPSRERPPRRDGDRSPDATSAPRGDTAPKETPPGQ